MMKPLARFRLQDLPIEILRIIVRHIVGCPNGVLDEPGVADGKYAYALCCNSSRLFLAFRTSFHTLFIGNELGYWEACPRALARLFGPFLQNLAVHQYSETCVFMRRLAEQELSLKSLSITIPRGVRSYGAFIVQAIESTSMTLRALRIEGPAWMDKVPARELRPYLVSLTSLSLRDIELITHKDLETLVSAPGDRLRHLQLADLYYRDVDDRTLTRIVELCPKLTHVSLHSMLSCTYEGGKRMALMLKDSLQHMEFDVFNVRRAPESILSKEARACKALKHVTLRWTSDLDGFPFYASTPHRTVLTSLGLYIMKELTDYDLGTLKNMTLNVRELEIQFCPSLKSVIGVLRTVGFQLHSLILALSNPADEIIEAVGVCKNLRKLKITGCKSYRNETAQFPLKSSVDNMLREIGTNLTEFTLDFRRYGYPSPDETLRLSGKSLANSLVVHCKNLRIIDLKNLIYIGDHFLATDEDDDAFEMLTKILPQADLYIDRRKPFWFDLLSFSSSSEG